MKLSEEAKKARAAYKKEWYKKNKEKQKEYNAKHWEKKVKENEQV